MSTRPNFLILMADQLTARALPARPAIPVLACMRLHAGAELTLSSFDYDISAQASVPVVALTANVRPEDHMLSTAVGMNGMLGKPVALHELLEQFNISKLRKLLAMSLSGGERRRSDRKRRGRRCNNRSSRSVLRPCRWRASSTRR